MIENYVSGVNEYIKQTRTNLALLPAADAEELVEQLVGAVEPPRCVIHPGPLVELEPSERAELAVRLGGAGTEQRRLPSQPGGHLTHGNGV